MKKSEPWYIHAALYLVIAILAYILIRVAIVEEKLPNDKLSYFIVTSDEDEKLLKKIGDVEALKKML